MTHTPAPWRISNDGNGDQEWRINAPNGDPTLGMTAWDSMAVVYGNDDEPELGSIVGEANARLIAAAPDTLRCADLLESLCAWMLHRFGPDTPEGKEASLRMPIARAAIAKARGETA